MQCGEEGLCLAHVPAVERERGEQDVARCGSGRAQGVSRDAGAGGRQRGRVAERDVAADDRHVEQPGGPRDPVQDLLRVRGVRAHEHVDERQRAARHRTHVGHVRDDRGGAGAERVGRDERRRHRLAADHELLAAVRHERRVVAVDAGAEPLDEPDGVLALESGRRSDGRGELLEVRHRRH